MGPSTFTTNEKHYQINKLFLLIILYYVCGAKEGRNITDYPVFFSSALYTVLI